MTLEENYGKERAEYIESQIRDFTPILSLLLSTIYEDSEKAKLKTESIIADFYQHITFDVIFPDKNWKFEEIEKIGINIWITARMTRIVNSLAVTEATAQLCHTATTIAKNDKKLKI